MITSLITTLSWLFGRLPPASLMAILVKIQKMLLAAWDTVEVAENPRFTCPCLSILMIESRRKPSKATFTPLLVGGQVSISRSGSELQGPRSRQINKYVNSHKLSHWNKAHSCTDSSTNTQSPIWTKAGQTTLSLRSLPGGGNERFSVVPYL